MTVLRVNTTFKGTVAGPDYLSSVFFSPGTAGGSNTDATDIVARVRAMWNAMAGLMAVGCDATVDPVCLAYDQNTGFLTGAFTGSPVATVSGTGTGDPLPLQTQGMIRWSTTSVINARRVRGRTFVPCPVEGANTTSGQPSGAYASGLVAGAVALLTAGATASFAVVWHRPVDHLGGQIVAITAGTASPNWAVLRTRRS